mmetsp:Transcript_3911/g.10332  ORF Transcript_3911/g.10332 Transcript_3911/m.10332 type:complete len:134 (-) Transcript_3911:15-416(-)
MRRMTLDAGIVANPAKWLDRIMPRVLRRRRANASSITKAQLARRMVLASLLGSSAALMAGPNNRANAHASQDTNGQDDEYECESSRSSTALAPRRSYSMLLAHLHSRSHSQPSCLPITTKRGATELHNDGVIV